MPLRHNNFGVVQGFSPDRIETATNLDTTTVLAVRVSAPISYKINGVGDSATMPAGTTIIPATVDSLLFASSTVCEIMGVA